MFDYIRIFLTIKSKKGHKICKDKEYQDSISLYKEFNKMEIF